jgi:predicted nucleic acid-binding protein
MIYLDTSVALAHLLGETRRPAESLWSDTLVASRLFEYEIWNHLHARNLSLSHAELARQMVGMVALVELAPSVLARALEPFPMPVRTLDALHLATVLFLQDQGQAIQLACYDARLSAAASALGIAAWPG